MMRANRHPAVGAGALLIAVGAVCTPATGQGVTYDLGSLGVVYYPGGDRSFADEVVSFEPGGDTYAPNDDPQSAIGPSLPYSGVSLGDDGTLGGTLVVRFTDNALVDQTGAVQCCDLDETMDLYIVEGGGEVEGFTVSISVDGSEWIDFEPTTFRPTGIDIGSHPEVRAGDQFFYVKIVEIVDGSSNSGDGWAGADIVSIGAIGSLDVIAPSGCTYSHGYWKTHPEDWPATELMLGAEVLDQAALLEVLEAPPRGDATYILGHQLVAAKLNHLSGADGGGVDAAAQIAAGDDWLLDHPLGSRPKNPDRAEGIGMAQELDAFNVGLTGPGHCPDE